MTGSGMAQRFADLDGTLIDEYQADTEMTDESGQAYPSTVNALLDNALGPQGYYGFFVANIHTDQAPSADSDAVIASAQSHGVPVISAKQYLDWIVGRNASAFRSMTWSGSTLSFTVSAAAGANGLQIVLPLQSSAGALSTVTRDGSAASFTTQTIKGIDYAIIGATSGAYAAKYGP